MNPPVVEILDKTVSEVLEGAAFLFADHIDPASIPDRAVWPALGVSLTFTGPRTGTFHMWAEDGFARVAAANMLGVDESDDESRLKRVEALKELLNIIVGRFITEAYGEDLLFDLGLPETLDTPQLTKERTGRESAWYDAEGTPLFLTMDIE